jgi:thiosulfate dehydrogenase
MRPVRVILLGAALLLAACDRNAPQVATPGAKAPAPATSAPKKPDAFAPPPESAIPTDEFGKQVALGRQIFIDPGRYAKAYVGNQLSCENCHLDAGRLAQSAPLWGAYPMYPAYRSKNHHVNTFAERLQGCFSYSMNGKAPPLGDPVLVALESYAYWMSKGEPIGTSLPGHGYPKLAKPALAPDYARGETVFKRDCALCHGDDGQGQQAAGRTVFPPLWGAQSFNWGAGMEQVNNAAGFIKANMPLGRGHSLTDQDAWDVAYYMDAHERPQDPRFNGSIPATRAAYHDTPDSLYGTTVNGRLLGNGSANP